MAVHGVPADPRADIVPEGKQEDEADDETWPDPHERTEDEEPDQARSGESGASLGLRNVGSSSSSDEISYRQT